jgi:hypothetical protein
LGEIEKPKRRPEKGERLQQFGKTGLYRNGEEEHMYTEGRGGRVSVVWGADPREEERPEIPSTSGTTLERTPLSVRASLAELVYRRTENYEFRTVGNCWILSRRRTKTELVNQKRGVQMSRENETRN